MAGLIGAVALGGRGQAEPIYQFGIFPYLPALKLEELYAPMVAEISAVLGAPLQIKTKSSFEAYRHELHRDTYDIILVHPFFYVEAIDFYGYQPLVRVAGDLRAVVLGRSDARAGGIEGLRGQTLAVPPRLAGVSYLIEMALLQHGLTPHVDVQIRHFRTKVSCLHAVAIGEADGCVIPSFMLDQLATIDSMGLVPVAESAPVPNLVFAASHRLDRDLRERLKANMLAWQETERGRLVLDRAHLPGLKPTTHEEFAIVRRHSMRISSHSTY